MTDPEHLIAAWLDGQLKDEEQIALAEWLKSDDSHMRLFVDTLMFEQQIRSAVVARQQQAAFSPVESPATPHRDILNPARLPESPSANFGISPVQWSLAAICVTFVVAFAFRWGFVNPDGAHDEAKPVVSQQIAVPGTTPQIESGKQGFCRLVRTASVRWGEDTALKPEVPFGARRVKIVSGTAEFRFDNGVRAICTGPSELELLDPTHAWLHSGQVVLRVPPAAIGFKLETRDAVIVDLGTEFGVRVDDLEIDLASGERRDIAPSKETRDLSSTELQVFEGEVIADVKSSKTEVVRQQHRVLGGQAMRIGGNAEGTVQELQFHPEHFVYEMPDPKDHPEAAGSKFPKKSPYNKARHESIRIMPAPAEVEIDGSLADWDLRGKFSSECPPPWRDFYNVQGALMYDEEFLYIGAEVADPFPMRSTVAPKPGRELYGGGGSVVLKISTDRKMGWPALAKRRADPPQKPEYFPEDCNERLVTLLMWYYAAESHPCLDVRYGIDHHGRRLNPAGYRGTWQKHSDGMGYTMEYAIPWSLLNAADDPPRAGDTLACTWLTHWSDSTGQNWRGQLIEIVNPKEQGWNFQNAGTWGRAIYEPAASAK